MSLPFEMVVFDLDGTLVDHEFVLSEETIAAVAAMRQMGLRVSVATGRGYSSAKQFLDRLEIVEPMVFSNGAVMDNPETGEREVISGVPLETALIAMMLLDQYPDLSAKAHLLGGKVLKSNAIEWPHEGTHFVPGEVSKNIKAELDDDPIKIVFFGPEIRLLDFKAKLNEVLGNKSPAKLFQSQPFYLEMVNGKTTKGMTMKRVVEALGIDPAKVIGVGDQENDYDLLRLFGRGVRVGDAQSCLEEVSQWCIDPPDQGGITQLLDLIRQEAAS